MAVAGRANGNSGAEIEEAIPIHIFDNGAGAPPNHERIRSRVRRRNVFLIVGDDVARLRTRQFTDDTRQLAQPTCPLLIVYFRRHRVPSFVSSITTSRSSSSLRIWSDIAKS